MRVLNRLVADYMNRRRQNPSMSEVLFYHLSVKRWKTCSRALERTRERDWRAVLRVGSAERMAALDAHL